VNVADVQTPGVSIAGRRWGFKRIDEGCSYLGPVSDRHRWISCASAESPNSIRRGCTTPPLLNHQLLAGPHPLSSGASVNRVVAP
jgi:hypothetical protein